MRMFEKYCARVLPLVYDQSLSYYENICKAMNYINTLIEQNKIIEEDMQQLKEEVAEIQKWISDCGCACLETLIEKCIKNLVLFQLSNDGYFVVYFPQSWSDVSFKTTGYDFTTELQPEFGHLVLLY